MCIEGHFGGDKYPNNTLEIELVVVCVECKSFLCVRYLPIWVRVTILFSTDCEYIQQC